jgi:protein-S-isoprenylcysteine O-methyltransferase Ste14
MTARLFFVPHPAPSAATVGSVAALLVAFFLAFQYANPVPASLVVGLSLIVLGIGVRLVTNSMLRKNEAICGEGLYAVCRHPMYVGTITAVAGIAVALNHALALALLGVAIAISLYRIRKEEEFLLAGLPDYAEYQREVPVFPTPGSVMRAYGSGRVRQQLSLRQCFLNGEVLRLNLYLPLLLASGFYLNMPRVLLIAGAVLSLALCAASMRLHPPESPRSRLDYTLAGVLGLAILACAIL